MSLNINLLFEKLSNAIERQFVYEYFALIEESTLNISNINEFEKIVVVFIKIERKYTLHLEVKYLDEYCNLIGLFQSKFIELVSDLNGQLQPLRHIYYIFEIIDKVCTSNENKKLKDIEQQLCSKFVTSEYSSQKQLFFNDLILICKILNSDKNALRYFLENVITMNIHLLSLAKYLEHINNLLSYFNIEIETIKIIFQKYFQPKVYFALNSVQRRSLYNWILHFFANIPKYQNSKYWAQLYDDLKNLLFIHFENKQYDEAMYVHFFLWHIMGNSYQTQEEFKKFNDEVTAPISKYYKKILNKNVLDKLKPKKNTEKIKIALVKDRIVDNSPTKVELSLIKALKKDKLFSSKYEIIVYSCNYFEKSIDDIEAIKKFEDLDVKVLNPNKMIINHKGYYHNHLEDAIRLRESIIDNHTDIMIVAVSSFPAIDFLLINRTAPKQIYWSHGNAVYNVENIDKRISHFKQDSICFDFSTFIISHELDELNKKVNLQEVEKERRKYPSEKIILGTIGRLIKLESIEYIKTIAKIMKKHQNTVYLACGFGNSENIKKMLEKFDIVDRFYFTGNIDPHLYGHIIDIWLDSFPLEHGDSKWEYVAKNGGKPMIMLEDNKNIDFFHEYIARGYKRSMIPIAKNQNIYIDFASQIIDSKEFSEKVGKMFFSTLSFTQTENSKFLKLILE